MAHLTLVFAFCLLLSHQTQQRTVGCPVQCPPGEFPNSGAGNCLRCPTLEQCNRNRPYWKHKCKMEEVKTACEHIWKAVQKAMDEKCNCQECRRRGCCTQNTDNGVFTLRNASSIRPGKVDAGNTTVPPMAPTKPATPEPSTPAIGVSQSTDTTKECASDGNLVKIFALIIITLVAVIIILVSIIGLWLYHKYSRKIQRPRGLAENSSKDDKRKSRGSIHQAEAIGDSDPVGNIATSPEQQQQPLLAEHSVAADPPSGQRPAERMPMPSAGETATATEMTPGLAPTPAPAQQQQLQPSQPPTLPLPEVPGLDPWRDLHDLNNGTAGTATDDMTSV